MKLFLQHITQLKMTSLFASILLVCCSAVSFPKTQESDNESTIKALFIYNFTKQIEWPSSNLNKSTFQICVLNDSEIADKLNEIVKGRKFLDKNFEVKNISKISEAIGSQILFIPKSKWKKTESEINSFPHDGLLIITEEKTIPTSLSSINLIEINHQMRFEINQNIIKSKI
ncbi:MAG: YfiR family protein [Bacteroidetes bacterium]|nr:YfiR family protein [Bacteroidota bacterium]